MAKKYLNHSVKTEIPEQFLEFGLVDESWKNDELGCMAHPEVEDFAVYPSADAENVIFGDASSALNPQKWFLCNFNDQEDCRDGLSVDEVLDFFQSKLSKKCECADCVRSYGPWAVCNCK